MCWKARGIRKAYSEDADTESVRNTTGAIPFRIKQVNFSETRTKSEIIHGNTAKTHGIIIEIAINRPDSVPKEAHDTWSFQASRNGRIKQMRIGGVTSSTVLVHDPESTRTGVNYFIRSKLRVDYRRGMTEEGSL